VGTEMIQMSLWRGAYLGYLGLSYLCNLLLTRFVLLLNSSSLLLRLAKLNASARAYLSQLDRLPLTNQWRQAQNLPLGRANTPLSALVGVTCEKRKKKFSLHCPPCRYLPSLNASSDLSIKVRTRGYLVVCQDILLESWSRATLAILEGDDSG
jgi:hypothetical protein